MSGFSASHLRLPGLGPESRKLPLLEARSTQPGPLVWLTACLHGDEVGGMVVIHELFRALRKQPLLAGRVMALPLMNPPGFESRRRDIPYSGEDLNRCFPGDPEGSLGRRLGFHIFQFISASAPDLVLDLHNDWNRSIPYGLLENHRDLKPICREYLRATGLLCVEETETLPGTLAWSLLEQGIAALTLELGESHLINESWVRYGTERIWGLLAHLGMVSPRPLSEPEPLIHTGQLLTYSAQPLSPASGVIRYLVEPGAWVKPRQPLARIIDPLGRTLATLKAQGEGVLLGHADSAVVYPGLPVMAFGRLGSGKDGQQTGKCLQ